jgi:hypothetical protein
LRFCCIRRKRKGGARRVQGSILKWRRFSGKALNYGKNHFFYRAKEMKDWELEIGNEKR